MRRSISNTNGSPKQFTKMEVERAKAARNLVLDLGCSKQKVIETIPNIENRQVTPQAVVNSRAIFGPLVSHLKGKSKNVKNAVAPVPQPRRGLNRNNDYM